MKHADQTTRTLSAVETVLNGRKGTEDILNGRDDRLMVVVGFVFLLLTPLSFSVTHATCLLDHAQ